MLFASKRVDWETGLVLLLGLVASGYIIQTIDPLQRFGIIVILPVLFIAQAILNELFQEDKHMIWKNIDYMASLIITTAVIYRAFTNPITWGTSLVGSIVLDVMLGAIALAIIVRLFNYLPGPLHEVTEDGVLSH